MKYRILTPIVLLVAFFLYGVVGAMLAAYVVEQPIAWPGGTPPVPAPFSPLAAGANSRPAAPDALAPVFPLGWARGGEASHFESCRGTPNPGQSLPVALLSSVVGRVPPYGAIFASIRCLGLSGARTAHQEGSARVAGIIPEPVDPPG